MIDSSLAKKPTRSELYAQLARGTWRKKTAAERQEIMRKVAAAGEQKERCPCGLMTLKRAIARRHVEPGGKGWLCRPGIGI